MAVDLESVEPAPARPSAAAIQLAISQKELPFHCYTPHGNYSLPAVDWVKMRDAIGAEDWRTYVALRHMLQTAQKPPA